MTMHVLPVDSGAACAGKIALFESVDYDDHKQAAALCQQCPALTLCQQLPNDTPGTKAGKLYQWTRGGGGALRIREVTAEARVDSEWARRRLAKARLADSTLVAILRDRCRHEGLDPDRIHRVLPRAQYAAFRRVLAHLADLGYNDEQISEAVGRERSAVSYHLRQARRQTA